MMSSLTSCFTGSAGIEKLISKEIERQLREAKKDARSQVKLLVLGTAESGKSTFIKQMRIIHGKGYTHEEKKGYISLIHQNITVSLKMLICAMEKLGIEYDDPENIAIARTLSDVDREEECDLTPECAQLIQKLWEDEGIQKCYLRRNEFHLFDSTAYYLNSLSRIASSSYVPTLQDILRTRVPTSGIVEYLFNIDHFMFGIVDVGGQKSERRKWIHCFESVTSIIFLAAVSEYDQTIPLEEISQDMRNVFQNLAISDASSQNNNPNKRSVHRTNSEQQISVDRQRFAKSTIKKSLRRQYSSVHASQLRPGHRPSGKPFLPPLPDINPKSNESPKQKKYRNRVKDQEEEEEELPSINRLTESCALFKTIVINQYFKNTSVILFLNKKDVLEEKIKHSPLSAHFPEFEGPEKDAIAAGDFLLDKYVRCFERVKDTKRTLYTHFTCATDTNNIRFVFAAVKDIILQSYLINYNLV